MTLHEWARKFGIKHDALQALSSDVLGLEGAPSEPPSDEAHTEAWVQSKIRLEASRKGLRLWRNNVGAGYSEDGSFLRWGLANDSAKLNEVLKSSDLIGIRPIIVGPHHLGLVIGQFVARECKEPKWKLPTTPTDREKAQLNFLRLINSMGGDARFAVDDTTL